MKATLQWLAAKSFSTACGIWQCAPAASFVSLNSVSPRQRSCFVPPERLRDGRADNEVPAPRAGLQELHGRLSPWP